MNPTRADRAAWVPRGDTPPGPLAGYRVLDLSAFAVGPWATSLLAALGADVVKVDPPYGDHIRNVAPSRHGEGTTYTVCNLGKRNIELDLKNEEDRALLHRLAAEADVVVENSREGAMDRLGVGYEALSAINPGIVYCASSSFGSSGPMARIGSTDPQGQAFSGYASIQGDAGGDPEFLRYIATIDLGTSAYLALAALGGLYQRLRTGRGCVIKTSQLEGALAVQATRIAEYLVAGVTPGPLGSESAAYVPSGAFRCRDSRDLLVSAPDDRTWQALCAALDAPDLATDPRFPHNPDRVRLRAELVPLLRERFGSADSTWWRGRLAAHGVPHALPQVLDDVLRGSGPEWVADRLVTLPHPVRGEHRVPGLPWRFSRTPAVLAPAPLPGQDTAAFRAGAPVGTAARAVPPRPTDPDGSGLPLAGLRVVEFGQGVATPYCGWLMATLGAEVTKVEPPGGDRSRHWAPTTDTGDSAAFRALNRGKRLRTPEPGLLESADVVLVDAAAEEAGEPGPVGELADLVGLTAVLCRIAEGEPGRPATELEIQALAGLTRYLGEIGAAPVRVGADLATTLAGAFGLQAVLAALIERARSGRGQTVEVSAFDGLFAVMSVMIAAMDDPDRWDGFHLLAAGYPPDHGVPTADGPISFSPPRRGDEAWLALCADLGADAVAKDERFHSDARRTPRLRELGTELAPYTSVLPRETVLEATNRHGGLGVPVLDYPALFAHPQVEALDVHDVADGVDTIDTLAAPWRIDGRRPHLGVAE